MKRRTWLLSAAGVAGALVVGWSVLPARSRLGSPALWTPKAGEVALNGWIKVAADGTTVLAMPRSEMGQGVHTALAMLVAEELDVPLASVRLETAGPDKVYGNVAMFVGSLPFHPRDGAGEPAPALVRVSEWMVGKLARELGIQVTGGSSSVADAWQPLRLAAASARAGLLAAAAAQWQVPVGSLKTAGGRVSDASGRSAPYAELAAAAAGLAPAEVALKARADWRVIGQPAPRQDVPSKVNGRAVFGLDVRPPGLVYAAVRMCPQLGGGLDGLDDAAALALPGVQRVVRLPADAGAPEGFAVVAASTWQAQQGANAVVARWRAPAGQPVDTQAIRQQLDATVTAALAGGDGTVFHARGDVAAAEAGAPATLEARYTAPYLAHATLEPMNCTAQVTPQGVTVWGPTQMPSAVRDLAARLTGMSADRVDVQVSLLGGGFGRRLEVDVAAQAVRVAMATEGRPVQVVWSREEDMAHDHYRPMQVVHLRAALDKAGQPLSLHTVSAGDAISPRWMARTLPALSGPVDMPDKTTAEGLIDQAYGFPNQRMAHVATRSGVPVGFWRSVGHSHNAFFMESFVDELAARAGQDPVAFRRHWLKGAPRHLAVLNLAAEKAGWGGPLPAGRARGVAVHESFGSVVAEVVEVSLQQGRPKVHRVVCAVDCGTVVNPAIVAQQMEGSVVFALTAALHGGVDIVKGAVVQRNFPAAPLLGLQAAPVVETWLVPSQGLPTGVGEPGVPPLAPAVANALHVLTGRRHRALPLV